MEAPAAKVSDATPSAPMANDVPSAPPAPIETFQSNECVVCMENKVLMLADSLCLHFRFLDFNFRHYLCRTVFRPKSGNLGRRRRRLATKFNLDFFAFFQCNIIFLPCGHVCSCWNCENGLSECPLCRAPIAQKVRLNWSFKRYDLFAICPRWRPFFIGDQDRSIEDFMASPGLHFPYLRYVGWFHLHNCLCAIFPPPPVFAMLFPLPR